MTLRNAIMGVMSAGLVAIPLVGCSGSGSASMHAGTGTIQVHLTDAPIGLADVQSVDVTITGVTVYPADTSSPAPDATPIGPTAILTHPDTFDLLTLTGGATALLASGEAPAGDYARIRLEVSDASLVYTDGRVEALKIQSGKVDIPIRFHLDVGEQDVITLDFDAGASVQVNQTASGQMILRPVVTPVN
jgi:hypothetical protein